MHNSNVNYSSMILPLFRSFGELSLTYCPPPPQMPSRCRNTLNIVVTTLFAAVVLFAILLAYVTGWFVLPTCHLSHHSYMQYDYQHSVASISYGAKHNPLNAHSNHSPSAGYQFIHTEQHHLSFGLYGAFLSLHLFLQSLFAYLEHRRMRSPARPQHLRRTVALCIAAYQEDPDYLRKCLRSVRRISFPGLKVVLVVDGNRPEDRYMMDIFQEVMGGVDQAGSMVWKGNYHSDGSGGGVRGGARSAVHMEEAVRVARLARGCRYSCVMQEWGGKREVMYTAFKALGDSVDYVQVRGVLRVRVLWDVEGLLMLAHVELESQTSG